MPRLRGRGVDPLFSSSIVWYLFLGGAGSGAYLVSVIIDLVLEHSGARGGRSLRALVNPGILSGLLIVLLGVVFLVTDLGRIDRAYTIFVSPTVSIASAGAWAIFLFSICASYVAAVRYLLLPEPSSTVTKVVESAGGVLALGVMAYTGVLLASMQAVALWASPFLPVLFFLSSLSTGIAVLMVCAFFSGVQKTMVPTLRVVSRWDILVVVLEAAAAALLIVTLYSDSSASSSVKLLLSGAYAGAFWFGYVLCGLLAPLVLLPLLSRRYTMGLCAWMGALLLVGGFWLRYGIVNAGGHDALITPFGVLSYLHMTIPA